jgi:hypothetical protein
LKVQGAGVDERQTPLACSLYAAQRAERTRWLGELGRSALVLESSDTGVTVRFRASDVSEDELRELAAAEARCCPFLTLEVRANADGVELRVEGPPDARPVIEEFCKRLV